MAAPNHWLVKQEPSAYSWDRFVKEGGTAWTGVRNFQARNNLNAMRKGDRVLYYHSVTGKAVVGVVEVVRLWQAYPDDAKGTFGAVWIRAVEPLPRAVSLAEIKADPALADMVLVKNSRLSVQPVTDAEFKRVLEIGG